MGQTSFGLVPCNANRIHKYDMSMHRRRTTESRPFLFRRTMLIQAFFTIFLSFPGVAAAMMVHWLRIRSQTDCTNEQQCVSEQNAAPVKMVAQKCDSGKMAAHIWMDKSIIYRRCRVRAQSKPFRMAHYQTICERAMALCHAVDYMKTSTFRRMPTRNRYHEGSPSSGCGRT